MREKRGNTPKPRRRKSSQGKVKKDKKNKENIPKPKQSDDLEGLSMTHLRVQIQKILNKRYCLSTRKFLDNHFHGELGIREIKFD